MGLRHRHQVESAADRLAATERHERRCGVAGRINLAVCFPGPYALAMSNLGFLTVHRLACETPDIGVERFFFGYEPGAAVRPPYYSFETRRPLGDFDILAFSFSFEGDFDRIPAIFGPLGLPVEAARRRRGRFPLLIAGGAAVAANAPALSRIFDVLVPGEAETVLGPMLTAFLGNGLAPESVADLPGVWVPALRAEPVPQPCRHDVAREPAWSHITTTANVFGGASLFEAMRGCPRRCAFCLARVIYHPARPVPAARLAAWLDERPDCRDLGLVAPSLFDHPEIEGILDLLAARGIRLRNSSVKWERLPDTILERLFACGVRGLTLAPETGSPERREGMGKPLREEAFYDTLERVRQHGFEHLKLYFMAGLPGETEADLDATAGFICRLTERFQGGFKGLSATVSGFVPKRGTAWEHEPVCPPDELRRRFGRLKMALRPAADRIRVQFESPAEVARQARLATVGPELAEEYEKEATACRERGSAKNAPASDLDF
ncbi:MAG TPA: radical SAM protein [Candidatus Ozemobacteraceae bacterium]|nr:radical SAM protein [Candidatus Ozemobacteraceae bacterium]